MCSSIDTKWFTTNYLLFQCFDNQHESQMFSYLNIVYDIGNDFMSNEITYYLHIFSNFNCKLFMTISLFVFLALSMIKTIMFKYVQQQQQQQKQVS